jgi:spore coat polysaccharide biosynthesis protein SpsF (cytidylyltransferase family)
MQSKKLKKKKLDEKAEKKKIAKEIHRLKASLKANKEIVGDNDDSDDDKME